MRNNIITISKKMVFLFSAALICSCQKLIELPGNPPSSITEAQQFADSASTMTAVIGTYSYFANGGGNFTLSDGQLAVNTGLSSDELNTNSNDLNLTSFYSYRLLSQNARIATAWNSAYNGLYPVNSILENVAASPTLSATFKTQIIAEMKVLRSLYYFNLVNQFGGVPLVLTTDYRVSSKLARSSVQEVYDQITMDLKEAEQMLPLSYPSEGRLRPNRYTALTLLAKIALYRRDWQGAYDAANTVISANFYSLEPDLSRVFLKGSREAIWQIPALNGANATRDASNFIPATNTTFPNYPITPFLRNAFEATDLRLRNWIGTSTVTVAGVPQPYYYPYKYKNRTVPFTGVEDFMIFRLAEVYLIRAEAAAQLGRSADAIADIRIIRSRAGLQTTLSPLATQAEILNAVMKERQTELFTEWGNRWYDLKRTGNADTVLGSQKTGWIPDAALYPIPDAQLKLNFFLTQNKGYN